MANKVVSPVALAIAGSFAISACTNPLPFGPGRIEIKLEKAAVERSTRKQVLGRKGMGPDDPVDFIRIDFSSGTNLIRYFDERDRHIQARCFVSGADDHRTYTSFGVGPIQEGIDITEANHEPEEGERLRQVTADRYFYTIHAFLDLKADDEEYLNGKPRGTLDLRSRDFENVSCFVIGVIKAPALFPRSNEITMSKAEIRAGIAALPAAR